jgi:hypothetical protein
VSAIIN